VELLRYPELRGLAVAIGGRRAHQPELLADGSRRFARLRDYVGRGVLTTATYEARALGVHSGMGTMQAARLAPDAILLPVDFEAYRHYSRLFKAAVREVAPTVEDRGIDEIYIDLSALREDSPTLARRLKAAVRAATGLSCSIGIAPNKLLAKICSDLEKPDGVTIIGSDDLEARIWPLPAKKINGIGPKAAQRLAGMGIHSIGELARADAGELRRRFGPAYGSWLIEAARGIDTRPVVTESEPKSVSRETTFERDLHPRRDRAQLSELFNALCRRVAEDLRRKGCRGRTIGIKLRYDDFRTVTRDHSLPVATDDPALIRRTAGECLRRVPLDRHLRLLGVRVGGLCAAGAALPEPSPQGELPL
jgi:DNA polymerase-4